MFDIYVSIAVNAQKYRTKIFDRYIYTGCPRRNVPDFGRVFFMLKNTDITQNPYIQSIYIYIYIEHFMFDIYRTS